MNCLTSRMNIQLLVDGDLDVAGRAELDAHLAQCSGCRRLARDLTAIHTAARALGRREIPSSARGPRVRYARLAALAATAAAAAIALTLILHDPSPVSVARIAARPPSPETRNPEPETRSEDLEDAWIDENADPNVIVVRVPTRHPKVHIFWLYPTVTLARADGGER